MTYTRRSATRRSAAVPGAACALAFAMLVSALLAAAPAGAQGFFGSSSNREGELAVRMNRIEEQMRALTGQIEELNHQLRVTQDQLRRAQEDNEFRFQQLEGGGSGLGNRSEAPPATQPTTQPAPSSGVATSNQFGNPAASGDDRFANERAASVRPLGETSPSSDIGGEPGVILGPSGQPLDLSALARGNAASTFQPDNPDSPDTGVSGVPAADDAIGQLAAAPTGGSPREEYDRAYNLVLRGDYQQAGPLFQQFLADHPDHALAANAQYWLGETFYGRGQYRDAADAFLKTYTDYPSNDKAPDSLLKLGLSLNGLGQTDAACATYSELLAKYPGASSAVLSKARTEQKSAGCRS